MARKSRNSLGYAGTEEGKVVSEKFHAAVYARLSQERDDTIERGTIENQVSLIKDYIRKQTDMDIAGIYVDDAVSGTTFERPGFERLMKDIRNGLINTVVVKDLSRLGRDYIETGNLIERVFPMLNIRFIAITDCFDSKKDAPGLMESVKNIANALYAQDISKKIYSSMHERMKNGIPVGAPPYGYKAVIGKNSPRQMVIDEEPANVIRRIVRYYLEGKTASEIVNILNKEGIPTPYQYKYRDRVDLLEKKSHLKWNTELVSSLMKNEVYTGKYVMGKDTKCLYKHEKRHITDKESWMEFENHHEAIISQEDYKKVNEARPKKKCCSKGAINLFKGKIFCGKCGSSMKDWPDHNKNRRYYVCGQKSRFGKTTCDCNNVGKDYAYDIVNRTLKEEMRLIIDLDEVIRILTESERIIEKKKELTSEMRIAIAEIEKIKEKKGCLYRDMAEGILEEKKYVTISAEFSRKIDSLKYKQEECASMLKRFEEDVLSKDGIRDIIKGFLRKRKLSQEMVDRFVEKIIVYEGKRLEIVFKFEDAKKELLEKRSEMEKLS